MEGFCISGIFYKVLFYTAILSFPQDSDSYVLRNNETDESNVANAETSTTNNVNITDETTKHEDSNTTADTAEVKSDLSQNMTDLIEKQNDGQNESRIARIYTVVSSPVITFFTEPKVTSVIQNVGTCMVNGMLDMISYYLPSPLIPLIVSAIGFMMPFEPVTKLQERMPVSSYKKAFTSALHTFMRAFNRYKLNDNYIDDPYMLHRFSRRVMNIGSEEKTKDSKVEDFDSRDD